MEGNNFNVLKPKGKSTTLAELYAFLKQFSLSDSLYVIGAINSCLKYGNLKISESNVPKPVINWIEKNYPDEQSKVRLSLEATRVARFLMLSKSNDFKNEVLDVGTAQLTHALYLSIELFEKDIEGEEPNHENLAKIMGRISTWQFPLQAQKEYLLGRAAILFLEIPNEFPEAYDMDAKMKEYFGLGLFEFIASGFCLWVSSVGILEKDLKIEIEGLSEIINEETLKKFIALSSGTPTDYKIMVRGENWKTVNKLRDIHSIDPFIKIPAIKIEKSRFMPSESLVLPQPFYLIQRACSGIFHLLADKERENGKLNGSNERNDFRRYFGEKIYWTYVGKQLSQAQSPLVFINLDDEIFFKGKKPDFAIIENEICILFEVKTSILSLESRYFLETDSIKAEVRKGQFNKAIEQLNNFSEAIINGNLIDGRFKDIERIIKIIVGYEDIFIANSLILPIIKEEYGDRVIDFQIATISDIEIIGVSLAFENNFGKLISKKLEGEYINWSFQTFLQDQLRGKIYKNRLLETAHKNFSNRLLGRG